MQCIPTAASPKNTHVTCGLGETQCFTIRECSLQSRFLSNKLKDKLYLTSQRKLLCSMLSITPANCLMRIVCWRGTHTLWLISVHAILLAYCISTKWKKTKETRDFKATFFQFLLFCLNVISPSACDISTNWKKVEENVDLIFVGQNFLRSFYKSWGN